MIQVIKDWYRNYFSDSEAVILLFTIIAIVLLFKFMGNMLAPAFVSVVISYLLLGSVNFLERIKIPHFLAVIIVFIGFLSLLVVSLLGLLPLLWNQITNLINELPQMIAKIQVLLVHLPERYPDYVNPTQIQNFIVTSKSEIAKFGQYLLSLSLSTIPGLIQIIIYLVLVPLLVYFFLMDQKRLLNWCANYMPSERRLVIQVWDEVNEQIGNYVRGKVIELIIVWLTTYAAFALMRLQYAMLLSVLVGFSVAIPYIGAIIVTVPVIIIALLQWGWSSDFFYLILIYSIIITLDANLLVPLLFSEVMKLHPVAIIFAILIFGGIWGFWGIFFAIPLATVVKAVLTAWPRLQKKSISHNV